MPIVSEFFGIRIRMFYQDHSPPHFHAEHQGQTAAFDLRGQIIAGSIGSRNAARLIQNWASVHRFELEINWARLQAGRPLEKIKPLG